MDSILLKKNQEYPMNSSNIASVSLKDEKCYTDEVTRTVLIVTFKRGPKYRYWPAGTDDLAKAVEASQQHDVNAWFQEFKNRSYEKIIE